MFLAGYDLLRHFSGAFEHQWLGHDNQCRAGTPAALPSAQSRPAGRGRGVSMQESPAWVSTNIDLRPGETARKHAAQFPLIQISRFANRPAQQLRTGISDGVLQWRRQNHGLLAENSEISENTATRFPATASFPALSNGAHFALPNSRDTED
jgi:hypothetical protein